MNNQLSIIKTRVRPSCDQCYYGKRRCNLTMPACSSCKKRELTCTSNRKNKRKPIMCGNEDFHSKSFLLFQSDKVTRKRKARDAILLSCKHTNHCRISLGGSRFNSNISIVSIFPIKSFHCPLLFDQSSNFFYKVAPNQYLNSFFRKMPPVESCNIIKDNIDIHYSVMQLIAIYFQRINLLLPLFTYNQFLSKKRDIVLVYSMILVVLAHIDDSDKSSGLKAALRDKVLEHLQPNRLKVSLNNIQSMVILLNGLKGNGLALPSYYFSTLNNCCVMLGLHLNYKNDAERKLCYSAVVFLLSIDDPYSNLSFDSHNLWKQYTILPVLNKSETIETIIQLVLLIYSSYCYNYGLFCKHFFDTLLHFDLLNISNGKVIKISILLEALLEFITERILSKYKMLKGAVLNKALDEVISIFVAHIKTIFHSSKAVLYAIKWAALDGDKESLFSKHSLNEKSKDSEDLKSLEANIQSFIIHSSKLKVKYYSPTRFFSFLLVIGTISSHSKWINNSGILLNQTLVQFNKLAKSHSASLVGAIELILQLCSSK
ncbi:hypothetical protein K502DRAFT_353856 [Neoconidiobolus thromboides FSU 785]|nr:hypothetical protein K502DRAFT_353856 [Neoconidiobolus thromboides FSU 785]